MARVGTSGAIGGRAFSKLARYGCALVGLLLPVALHATGTLTQTQEWAKRISAAQHLSALDTTLFGDSTNLYNGQTTFTVTDVSLPGNDALPVRIGRTLAATDWEYDTAPGLFGNWDIDLPYLSGTFAADYGWVSDGSDPGARCSGAYRPPILSGPSGQVWHYWRGNYLYVPGAGRQAMLLDYPAGAPRPNDGQTYRQVTRGFWQFRCLSRIADPSSQPGFFGEGFVALAPDGTQYYFDWMTRRNTSTLVRPWGYQQESLARVEVRLYPTRIVDRFGNSVTYTWSGDELLSISASDGRKITLTYTADGHIATVTANGRTWTYSYASGGELTRVQLPDGSAWTLSTAALALIYQPPSNPHPPCDNPGTWYSNLARTYVFTHPSGAVGEFTFAPVRRSRTQVSTQCSIDPETGRLFYGPPIYIDNFALTAKKIHGPGLPTLTWTLSYSPPQGGYVCSGSTCPPDTSWTQVQNPDGTASRYTFGIRYYIDEGKLLRTQVYAANGTLVRDTSITYALSPSNPPYPVVVGKVGYIHEDAFADTHLVPRTATSLAQDGDTYTNAVNGFDGFARPVSVTRSNSFGFSRTDVTAYYDNLQHWVIGQVASITNSDTSTVISQTDYDPITDQPANTYAFGLLQYSFTYNADGTLASASDALNRTTRFSGWNRGLPQRIDFADGSYKTAVVDGNGFITSTTDARGNTTAYTYDGLGRLTRLVYPAGDSVAWAPWTAAYSVLTAPELGVPAGSWRARSVEGRLQVSTYYDALWRPVLTEEKDTTTGTVRYTKTVYDNAGHVAFKSYPSTSSSPTAGIDYRYDALGRLIQKATSDGVTLSTLAYLSGNRQQVTDAAGNVTTTSYQAFDSPGADNPIRIQAPAGQTTTIDRNVFGEALSATQSGAQGSVTDTYLYDAYHRLCKRITPESGQSVIAYDAASEIAWTAEGQSGSSTSCDYASVAATAKVAYTYDLLGRKTGIVYPDATGNVTLGYDPDGHLTSATNPTAAWVYTWNHRGLLQSEQAVIDGNTFTLNRSYDAQGHLASLTYPDGRVIAYAPDAWGRPTQLGSYATGVSYFPNGLPNTYTLGNGLVVTQSLDARLRLAQSQLSGSAGPLQHLAYTYSDDDDLTAITDFVDGADSARFGYDGLHRLTSASGLWGSYSYTYDAFDNLTARSGGDTPLAYRYDPATDRLLAVTVPAPQVALSATPATILAGGGSTLTWASQDAATCTASGAWSGSQPLSGSQSVTPASTSTYTLTCSNSIGSAAASATVTVTQPAPTLSFSADPTSIPQGSSSTLSWSSSGASACTASGNWSGSKPVSGSQSVSPITLGTHTYTLTCTGAGGSVTASAEVTVTNTSPCRLCSPQSAPAPNLATAAPGAALSPTPTRQYAYDAQGRITADGVRTYTWNAASELVSIPGVAAYAYDANGKRIKTVLADGTVEYALYDLSGSRVYTQRLSGAALTQTDYLDLAGAPLAEIANGNPTYLHPDLLGSPRLATGPGQQIRWREHYEPYGQKLNGVNEKVGYTGAAYDAESGLTYLQARFYDAQVGRFLSTDPLPFTGDPSSFNRYAYGYDNPYRYTDPTGRCPPQVCQGGDYNLEGFNAISVEGTRIGAAPGSIGVPIVNPPSAAAMGNTGSSFGQTVNAGTGAQSSPALAGATAAAPAAGAAGSSAMDVLGEFVGRALGVIGMALSLSGDAQQYDYYQHYGYAADEPKFAGGLKPRSWATQGPIMSGQEAQQSLSLMHSTPPDSYYQVAVPRGLVPVVGPMIVPAELNFTPPLRGGGIQFYFPEGTPPGSVTGPFPLP